MFYRVEFNVSRLWSAMFRPNLCSWLRFNLINPSYEHEEDRGKSHVHPRKIQGVVVVVFIFVLFVFWEKNRLSQIFPKFPLWVSGFKTHPGVHFIVSHLTQKLRSEDLFPTNHLTITLPLISHYYTVTIPSLYTITIYHHYTITIPLRYCYYSIYILLLYCQDTIITTTILTSL